MGLSNCVRLSHSDNRGRSCGSNWKTRIDKGDVIVSHFNTDLVKISKDAAKVKIATGFESPSDRSGMGKILKEFNFSWKDVKEIKAQRGFRF